jgi:formylglycine-generating enzyme required for sulfatase activity
VNPEAGLRPLKDGGTPDADSAADGAAHFMPGPSCARMKGNECAGSDCCSSFLVPGGTFPMGRSTVDGGADDAAGDANEVPEHSVTVSSFRLDEFEVTVGRFRRFFDSYDGTPPMVGAGQNPNVPGSGWQAAWNDSLLTSSDDFRSAVFCSVNATFTSLAGKNDQLPINCVTWYEAFAFCAWDGGRLPTDAEWEYAAAGGADNRLYPWGSEVPDDTNDLAVIDCAAGGTPGTCTPADILAVGSMPAGKGRYGQLDLAGSMMELVLDWYDASFYARPQASGKDVADLSPTTPTFRVVRGGNYITPGLYTRAAAKTDVLPTSRFDGVGFRCARDR